GGMPQIVDVAATQPGVARLVLGAQLDRQLPGENRGRRDAPVADQARDPRVRPHDRCALEAGERTEAAHGVEEPDLARRAEGGVVADRETDGVAPEGPERRGADAERLDRRVVAERLAEEATLDEGRAALVRKARAVERVVFERR